MKLVRDRVHAAHGIWLHAETRLVGFSGNPALEVEVDGHRRRARTAAIDPRLRARRIAVRRDEVAGGCAGSPRTVSHRGCTAPRGGGHAQPVLDVDRVEVSGSTHTSVDAVQRAAGIHRHAPMTDIDLDKARQGVLALPWCGRVDHAKLALDGARVIRNAPRSRS